MFTQINISRLKSLLLLLSELAYLGVHMQALLLVQRAFGWPCKQIHSSLANNLPALLYPHTFVLTDVAGETSPHPTNYKSNKLSSRLLLAGIRSLLSFRQEGPVKAGTSGVAHE